MAERREVEKRKRQDVQKFRPEEALKRDSQADAIIAYAKRVKDWKMLETAVDQKLSDQQAFVEWWTANVTIRQGPGRGKTVTDLSPFSVDEAEKKTGITKKQVSRWRKSLRDPDAYREELIGVITMKIMAGDSGIEVHFSSDSPEWYTPEHIVEKVVETLGTIDLDPCADLTKNVPAKRHYTEKSNGLNKEWHGRVYMNPPYGKVIDQWVDKLAEEFDAARTTEAVALVPARVDTEWFRKFRNFSVCFIKGRLKFSGHDNSAPFPSAVIYLGHDIDRFHENFHDVGDIWIRWEKD